MSLRRPIRRGDLVLTVDHDFALVRAVSAGSAEVRLGNGLVVEVRLDHLIGLPMGPGDDPGRSAANFLEELRPDWADPLSPRYAPPGPDLD